MPINMIYREAEPSDAGKVLEYLKRVGGESDNLTFGEEGLPFSISQEADYIRKIAGSHDELMLLGFDEGELVACGSASVIDRRIRFIHRKSLALSVRKDYWGKGIGSKIMEIIIDFSKKSGAETLELEVRSDNKRGIALYEKFGFKKIGTNERFMKIDEEYISVDYMTLNLA